MPESFTANATRSSGRNSTLIATLPVSVNLIALDSRFFRICSTRRLSVTIEAGASGWTCASNASFFSLASGVNTRCSDSTRRGTDTNCGCRSRRPASTLDRSRMSLIRLSRSLPAP